MCPTRRPPPEPDGPVSEASGSPVTTAWMARHAGHPVLFRPLASRAPPSLRISDHLAPFARVDGFPARLGGALLPRLLRGLCRHRAHGLYQLGDPTFVLVIRHRAT